MRRRDALYWFTSDDERIIQQHNSQYQELQPVEQLLSALFAPCEVHRKENFWQVVAIQKELAKHLRSEDVPSLRNLGIILKKLRLPHGGVNGTRGYYLQLKQSAEPRKNR